jgi:hypothetical protein
MGITAKIKDLNNADLSGLAKRVSEIRPNSDAAASQPVVAQSGTASAAFDETWVRRTVLPVLDKIGRLRS